MSGGSFDYLCFQEDHFLFQGSVLEEMQRMGHKLIELGFVKPGQDTLAFKVKLISCMQEIHDYFIQYPFVKTYLDYTIMSDHEYFSENELFAVEQNVIEDDNLTAEQQMMLQQYIDRVRQILISVKLMKEKFEDLWKSVEWYCSADSGMESVMTEAKNYIKKIG